MRAWKGLGMRQFNMDLWWTVKGPQCIARTTHDLHTVLLSRQRAIMENHAARGMPSKDRTPPSRSAAAGFPFSETNKVWELSRRLQVPTLLRRLQLGSPLAAHGACSGFPEEFCCRFIVAQTL